MVCLPPPPPPLTPHHHHQQETRLRRRTLQQIEALSVAPRTSSLTPSESPTPSIDSQIHDDSDAASSATDPTDQPQSRKTTTHHHSSQVLKDQSVETTVTTTTTTTKTIKYKPRRNHAEHAKAASKKAKFKPRSSPLDFDKLERDGNSMRGFYVLFWWALAWSAISTAYETFMATGSIFKWSLFMQMSDRGKELVVSDAAMILSCFVVVPLVKLVQYKVIPLKVAWIVNSVWLAVWFVTVVSWAYVADWKWTQSGSFVIHCIAMLMKQASYLMSNVDNFWKVKEIPILKREIELLSAEITSPSVDDPTKAEDTKKALTAIETELAIFEGDLKGRVTGLEFPKNLTLFNFIDYMAIPCLVYEIEYPRTTTFRPFYFLMKVAGTLGTFFLLVFIVQHQIIPVLEISTEINFVTSIMRLIGPFMLCFLLVFFIIFEFICNAFAELTFFADREFYEDWWNSTTFDEYARRWNKPVHEFLLRHVYLENITTNKIPRYYSSLLTFFISSLFHELVMAMTGKRLRPWLFLLQMFQIPLIWMASLPFIKSNRTLGNVIFWGGMFLGPPLLGACYAREHYLRP